MSSDRHDPPRPPPDPRPRARPGHEGPHDLAAEDRNQGPEVAGSEDAPSTTGGAGPNGGAAAP